MSDTFLNVVESKSFVDTQDHAVFSTVKGETIDIPCAKVADCVFKQTFNLLFEKERIVDGISGNDRMMDLLNSLLFPKPSASDDDDDYDDDYYDFTIKEISDDVPYDTKRTMGIAYKCCCWKGTDKPDNGAVEFNIEVVMCYRPFLQKKLTTYYQKLPKTKRPDFILAFYNYDRRDLEQSGGIIKSFERDEDKNTLSAVNIFGNIILIDVSLVMKDIKDGKIITTMGGEEIGKEGLEWLKLLGIRQWAQQNGARYIVPREKERFHSAAVWSCLTLLESVDDFSLNKYVAEMSSVMKKLKGYWKEGFERGWKKGWKKGEEEGKRLSHDDELRFAKALARDGFLTERFVAIFKEHGITDEELRDLIPAQKKAHVGV